MLPFVEQFEMIETVKREEPQTLFEVDKGCLQIKHGRSSSSHVFFPFLIVFSSLCFPGNFAH